jgi:Xaa-Pro aminopeptidase
MMTHCDTIYINTNEHYRATVETETREARFVKWWKDKYPAHVCQSNLILQRLRSVKETEELDLIQKSLYITELGFRRILPLKPNVTEYEIEAELIHDSFAIALEVLLTRQLSPGNNANVLHYIENNQQCKAGDLILLDVAAEYANYSSDMSRTIRFQAATKRQKEVYNAVLNVKTKLQKC